MNFGQVVFKNGYRVRKCPRYVGLMAKSARFGAMKSIQLTSRPSSQIAPL